MPPQVHQLTPAENAWMAEQLRRAKDFVSRYASTAEVTVATLDTAWQRWISEGEMDTDAINAVSNAVGIAFGQALAGATPLRWVMAKDQESSELALLAFPGKGDLLIFPANLVAKRWERKEAPFLASTYAAIVAQVEMIGKSQQKEQEPFWKHVLMGHGD
ncbi:MAG: DUF3806 domain-containing protein [Thermoanaerobaculia bacterium]